jgi:hypothetical protein
MKHIKNWANGHVWSDSSTVVFQSLDDVKAFAPCYPAVEMKVELLKKLKVCTVFCLAGRGAAPPGPVR